MQPRRNAKAAKRFFARLVAALGDPNVVITDKLRNFTKPIQAIALGAGHRTQGSHQSEGHIDPRGNGNRSQVGSRRRARHNGCLLPTIRRRVDPGE
nr:hypothetical protein [Pseudooceanicola lipolyticus]